MISTYKVQMSDTGIGREAGYSDDREFIEAMKEERARLSPETRDLLDEIDREYERRFLFGDP